MHSNEEHLLDALVSDTLAVLYPVLWEPLLLGLPFFEV